MVSITVEDVDDTAPRFVDVDNWDFEVNENRADDFVETRILQLIQVEDDDEAPSIFTFTIE